MPSVNLRPNRVDSEDFVEVSVEFEPADDEQEEAGLSLVVKHEEEGEVNAWETDADAIREFRDLVVQECDKALAALGG